MRRRSLLLFGVLAWLTSWPTPAFAGNGLFPIADGPRQRGRGGTVLAIAEDAFAINSNPAGIAFIDGRRLDLGVQWFFQRTSFTDPIQPGGVHGKESIPQTQPIAPGFGLAFDNLRDISDLFRAGLGLVRGHGGAPGEVPSIDQPAEGQVGWNVDGKAPTDIKLMAAGLEATISEVTLFGFFRQSGGTEETTTVLERRDLPALPAGAKVIGVGVDFVWRYTAQLTERTPRVRLEVDGRTVSRELDEPGRQWTPAATSLILDQESMPGRVAFRVQARGNALGVARVRLRIGYKTGERYRWIKIDLRPPRRVGPRVEVVQLARSVEPRSVDGMGPRVIHSFRPAENPAAPADARLVRLAFRYRYRYKPSKSIANLLHVRALADGLEAAHTSHSMTERPRQLPPPGSDLQGPLPPPKRHDRLKFGIGLFPQGGAGIEIDIQTDLFPDGLTNKSDLLFISLAPAVAWRPTENFSVGAALLGNFARMELDGLISEPLSRLNGTALSGIRFSSVFTALSPFDQLRGSIDMEQATTFGVTGKFGLMWKLTDTLTFGASYTTQSFNRPFKTRASVDFTQIFEASGLLLTLPALIFLPNGGVNGLRSTFDMEVDFQLPQQAGMGLAWRPEKWVRLSADVRWIDWSSTMDEVEVKLTNGSNPDVAALVGSRDIETTFRIGWQDMYVLALGAEFFVDDKWVVRFGYNANSNPLKDDRFTSPQIPALTVEHLTFGFSYLTKRTDFHFAYSLGLRNQSREEKGESAVSADFDFVEVAFGPQHVLAAGLTWRY